MPYISGAGGGGSGAGADGWVTAPSLWTYASATTFTVATDVTATFSPGTRIKLTQTTVKYFVVVSSAFGAVTTVTVTGGTDYSLANAAISANFYSYAVNPLGYPGEFNWVPAWGGFTATTPTVTAAKFSVVGKIATVEWDVSVAGTSNATSLDITNLPILPVRAVIGQVVRAVDNGANAGGQVELQANNADAIFHKGITFANWTNTGNKYVEGIIVYPFA